MIEGAYARAFASRISAHYPLILASLYGENDVMAAAGVRMANQSPLFLEHYLDRPVERELLLQTGEQIARTSILEVGNFAARASGPALRLFAGLADHAQARGAIYACATATRALRRAFRIFGFPTVALAPARRARAPNAGADWGRYYETDPIVIAGRVSDCRNALCRRLKAREMARP